MDFRRSAGSRGQKTIESPARKGSLERSGLPFSSAQARAADNRTPKKGRRGFSRPPWPHRTGLESFFSLKRVSIPLPLGARLRGFYRALQRFIGAFSLPVRDASTPAAACASLISALVRLTYTRVICIVV